MRNAAFDASRITYAGDYESSLHFSPRFQSYAEDLAEYLVDRYQLDNCDVVEIGCGQGEFLSLLCRGGRNRGLGFDRSYRGPASAAEASGTRILSEDFSPEKIPSGVDLICCRHVLEHVAHPLAFLRSLRAAGEATGRPAFYFEVPDGLWTVRDLGIWDLIYEHCSYFTAPALHRLLVRTGFRTSDVRSTYGGQFLRAEAELGAGEPDVDWARMGEVAEVRPWISRFARAYAETVATWRAQMERWRDAGHRTAVWGAGSKGVTFLSAIQTEGAVQEVIDLNPRKRGRYVPGTGHRIGGPERLLDRDADHVLVTNPLYLGEVRKHLAALGSRAELRSVS
jgi:SAM-dependent methyltransferase